MHAQDILGGGPWAGGNAKVPVLDAASGHGGQAPLAALDAGRLDWVSWVPPRRAWGWLPDKDEFEGTWLAGAGRARFRLAGCEEEAEATAVASEALAA